MYVHIRKYRLVNAPWRNVIKLDDYDVLIKQIISSVFGADLVDVVVEESSFTIMVNCEAEKLPHGVLVNMGKKLAANLQHITACAMRTYQVNSHPDSRQLFHCFDAACL